MHNGITGAIVDGNPLLVRTDRSDREIAAERATLNLKIMHHNGELHIPQPWTNDLGEQITPWCPEEGDAFVCYMDILGLNGRPLADSMKWETRNRRRAARRSQREEDADVC